MSDESHGSFFEELRRRSVFRAAAAYLVIAWVLIQVADTVFPYLGLSERIITFLIVFLAIGFVITLMASWAYEMTPEGLRRDDDVERSAARIRKPRLRAFDYVIAAILTAVIAGYAFNQLPQQSNLDSSIAVLPFENRSANPDDVYFVDGVHDDILTSLANIGSMKVISRTSVEPMRGTELSVPEIGAELGVTSILEGGVQRSGDTIRINVQLIDVATDSHLWAKIYDRALTAENVFAIQSEIATTIAAEMRAALTPEDETRLVQVPTDSLEAYELYLLGNQRIQRRTGASLEEAIDYFEEAIELDADFALAYVGLADCYMLLTTYGNRTPKEALEPALAAVSKAIELDPNNGEAYATLAQIHHDFRTGIDPEPLFVRALRLNPNYAPGHQWYSELLSRQDRSDAALSHLQTALQLDPLSPIINTQLGNFYRISGRFDDARTRILRALEIDPLFARSYVDLTSYYRDQGRWAHALTAIEEAYRLNPAPLNYLRFRAEFLTQMGDIDAARRVIDESAAIEPEHGIVLFATAHWHTYRSDAEAFEYALDHWYDVGRRGFYLTIIVNGFLRMGEPDKALTWFDVDEDFYALPDAPDIALMQNRQDTVPTILYVLALQRAGRIDEAKTWLDVLLEYYAEDYIPIPGDENLTQYGLLYLVEKAQVLMLSGDRQSALTMLQRAVDAGMSRNSRYFFEHDLVFAELHDEPAFQAMNDTVRAAMAEQLRTYRAGEITLP